MLKALPIVSALLAATTLWGQPEPVGVTLGQTVRLTVTARPPDSCAAQIGFLDNGGKPIGASSHVLLQPGQSATLDLPASAVVKEAGQRVEIQPRIVPDQGIAASACQADMEVNEAKPSGGPREGVKVHGHWTIDVRNPDGTLASHRDFENSLQLTGAAVLVGTLDRSNVTGLWQVALFTASAPGPCNSGKTCYIGESAEVYPVDSRNLTVTSGPTIGSLVLTGSVTVVGSGTFLNVATLIDVCLAGGSPTSCTSASANSVGTQLFTNAAFLPNMPNVPVVAGQLVQVTVMISFS
jgi:hypothetical protein